MTKVCTKCKVEKDLSEFGKDIHTKDGRTCRCKTCRSEDQSAYHSRNREKENARVSQWQKDNRDKVSAKTAKWRANNPDKNRDQRKALYAADTEKFRDRHRRYYANDPDKFRMRAAIWRKNHPEQAVIQAQRRRARKAELLCDLTFEQWIACLEHFDYLCAYCGSDNDSKSLHQDHVIALSKGGPTTIKNIIPACQKCNSSKHSSELVWWYQRQTFYSPDRLGKIQVWIGSD